ncbi:ABC transporter ATP-binding protein [Clostridiales bacterium COT073_COT-073]|nr:ABC transporter ATP-binding protein [Clostridiales bacterium COT073_COT-073]
MKQRTAIKALGGLIGLVRPLTGVMIAAITMGILGFLAAIGITTLGGFAIISVLGAENSLPLKTIFGLLVVFAVCRGILRYAEQAANHYIAFKLLALIRDKVFANLRKLAPAKLEGKDKGNLISVITSDIELLEVFYAHTISPVCIAVVISLIMTGFIGSYHMILGAIAFLAYLAVGVVLPYFIARKAEGLGKEHRHRFGELNSFFLDSLRGLRESIQYQNGEERLLQINAQTDEMSEWEKKLKDQAGKNFAISGFLVLFFTLLMFAVSSFLYLGGQVDLNGVIIPTIAMSSSFGAVLAIANLGSGLSHTIAAANRVLDILEEEPMIEENKEGASPEFTGASLAGVDFAYEEEAVLNDFSMEIQPGGIIGLIGKSGSGKSTMLKLLMRFWDRDKGQITISGHDVKEIKTKSLRDMEGYVTQETVLFKDSIENNIRVAKLDATAEEIEAACRKASIHDFIMTLPDGYATEVGELGDTLSGGERQRIGLARAFLHNAPLLLLDEPTSNLDSLNEAVILKALKEDGQRTTVLVSHRLSTMTIADKVYSVESGRVS